MKQLSIYIALFSLVAFSSCKKSSSSQSIVGTWKFSNISGTVVNNSSTTSGNTTTYSYNPSINTITASTVTTIGTSTSTATSTVSVTTETWTFNSDGTYTISEGYTETGLTAVTSNSSGTWDYLSNSKTNDEFLFSTGATSAVLNLYGLGNSIYTIKSVGGTMVLTLISAETDNTGRTYSTNVTLTFTKS